MFAALQTKIKDYHLALVKQVELKASNLKATEKSRADYVENKRSEFVLTIEHCELINQKHLSATNLNEFLPLLKEEDLVLSKLMKEFCFFIDKSDYEFTSFDRIDATFGYLVITDEYMTKTQLECFKELFRYYLREKTGPWSKLLKLQTYVNFFIVNV
jgi:hypothetical protein